MEERGVGITEQATQSSLLISSLHRDPSAQSKYICVRMCVRLFVGVCMCMLCIGVIVCVYKDISISRNQINNRS